ncbi:hypothetical protein EVAR_62957_1 [Eumeta japonica]|uniref:Uncharacterized protein n=1 Tax=Eumeta variegata TaxID=151549 RepID=A0A4C1ZHX6_EUMVA|nr:hypothetical protein EVAR_62957_1 [Eumeta japonica]
MEWSDAMDIRVGRDSDVALHRTIARRPRGCGGSLQWNYRAPVGGESRYSNELCASMRGTGMSQTQSILHKHVSLKAVLAVDPTQMG